MRLIDADALMAKLTPEDWRTPDERWMPERQIGAIIQNTPTIDAVEADLHTDGTLWIKIDHLKGVVAIKSVVLSCSRWCATFVHEEDAVEVVRCRDCKHRDPEDKKCDCGEFERAGCIFAVDDDYFCSYGERRD